MLTYTFTRREKALLLVLALVLIVIVWFIFVYQSTTNKVIQLEGEIAAVQSEISIAETRVAQKQQMTSTIEQRKAEGVQPTIMPYYDNMQALMEELNYIMSAAQNYSLSFDSLTEDEKHHVLRGARIDYSTASFQDAEAIVRSLAGGRYPCRIDSVNIVNSDSLRDGVASTTASVHVTFFEQIAESGAGD